MNTLVSIIMPVFNGEKHIVKAIDSVFNQTHRNWELLIINDGSTDTTPNILNTYQDKRIKIFHQDNKGVSSARNTGLKHMKGTYLLFFDSDDLLPNNSISSRLKVFEKDNNIDFVDGSVLAFQNNITTVLNTWTPAFKGNPTKKLIQLSPDCFRGLTWLMKVDAHTKYMFSENMSHAEDLLFYINTSSTGKIYNFVSSPVLYYRQHNSAMSNLRGLEEGYKELYNTIKLNFSDCIKEIKCLKRKIIRFMFLDYVRRFDIISSLRILWWGLTK